MNVNLSGGIVSGISSIIIFMYRQRINMIWEIVIFVKSTVLAEIIFIVEESAEGGYEARALENSIFTAGETVEELKENIKEAIRCHFEKDLAKIIRLHYIKEEVIAA